MNLTLKAYIDGVKNGTLNPQEVVHYYLQKSKDSNTHYNAYLTFADEYITVHHNTLSSKALAGAPIALKDLIQTKGIRTTFGSKIAENYIPAYSATCFTNLEDVGGCLIGKTNLDEFAMGGSNENSAFGPVKNPYGENRIAGGSSGGSAAAVAADLCVAALGTDTGGSVRQPAFMCGIVGLKPTYGRVSRYGVQAMASSFDQVGTFTKTVEDASILLAAISGHDEHDATSARRADVSTWQKAIDDMKRKMQDYGEETSYDGQQGVDSTSGSTQSSQPLSGRKIGYFTQFFDEGIDPLIAENTKAVLAWAEKQGATVVPLDFQLLKYMVAIYYILMPAEVSTNLARWDGIRYGLQDDTSAFALIKDYYASIRERGFGTEVKRRILTGSYVLSAGFYDAYYRKAQKVRNKMQQNMLSIFADVDVILGPTSPELARKIGERTNDPLKNYLADIYTIPANVGGFPAMNVPTGFVEKDGEQCAVGIQLMANHWREDILFEIGSAIEVFAK